MAGGSSTVTEKRIPAPVSKIPVVLAAFTLGAISLFLVNNRPSPEQAEHAVKAARDAGLKPGERRDFPVINPGFMQLGKVTVWRPDGSSCYHVGSLPGDGYDSDPPTYNIDSEGTLTVTRKLRPMTWGLNPKICLTP